MTCRVCRSRLVVALTGRPRRHCSDRCRQAAYRKRQRRSVHFSSKTCEWSTPQWLYDEWDAAFGFELDVCATAENAKCERFFTREDDGLAQTWTGTCWMNPPYRREIRKWMEKAYRSAQAGATVVCLVPARPGSAWWHDYAMKGEITFHRGRLRFGDARASAPFDSAIVVFRNASAVTKPVREVALREAS